MYIIYYIIVYTFPVYIKLVDYSRTSPAIIIFILQQSETGNNKKPLRIRKEN